MPLHSKVGVICIITLPAVGGLRIVISPYRFISLSVCMLAYVENQISKLHKICCAFYLQPWLGRTLMTVQHVVYFRFCG